MDAISFFKFGFLFCFLSLIFLILRKFPYLVELQPKENVFPKTLFSKTKKSFLKLKKKASEKSHLWREKNIHRARILILKLDNFLGSYLEKLRQKKIYMQKRHSFFSKRKKKEK